MHWIIHIALVYNQVSKALANLCSDADLLNWNDVSAVNCEELEDSIQVLLSTIQRSGLTLVLGEVEWCVYEAELSGLPRLNKSFFLLYHAEFN